MPNQPVILERPKEEDDGAQEQTPTLPPQTLSMEKNLSFMPDNRPQAFAASRVSQE